MATAGSPSLRDRASAIKQLLADSYARAFRNLAKRTLFLFATLAVVPLAIIGLVTIYEASAHLTQQATRELNESAKNYGLQLFDRLSMAKRLLSQATIASDADWTLVPVQDDDTRLFDAIERVYADERQFLRGDRQRLSAVNEFASVAGKQRLLIRADGAGHVAFVLLHPFRDRTGRAAAMLATLNADYLWQPANQSQSHRLCVHDARGMPLFCSAEDASASSAEIPDDYERLSSSWSLFMPAAFGIGNWEVTASQNEAIALAPIEDYKSTLFIVMLGALALIILLSSIQIRRSHRPLENIIDATRRIAVGRFDHSLDIKSGDEFQELAEAINHMNARLGQQFQALSALSHIDRCILDSAKIDPMIETVLSRAQEVLRCNVAAVALFDSETETLGRLHLVDDRQPKSDVRRPELSRIEWPALDGSLHGAGSHGVLVDRSTPGVAALQAIWDLDVQCCLLIAVPAKTRISARFVLGFRESPDLGDPTRLNLIRDFTDRIAVGLTSAEREQTLFRQAHYDVLTQLPNRLLFRDRLEQELAHARRDSTRIALLFIDLDRFKNINDSLGHTAGDQLLKLVATRFAEELRDVDTIARLGGDEFTVILPQAKSVAEVSRVCERLLQSLSQPFALDGTEYFVGASVGVALYPHCGESAEELIRNADTAMYRAKAHARGSYAFYEETMNLETRERVWLEAQLRRAVERDEFALLFQPQVELHSGRIVGAEALIRWNHAERGVIAPDSFIHIAEETNLIVPIGRWVIANACRQLQEWRARGIDIASISVNVAVPQVRAHGFADFVRSTLRKYQIDPRMLELEITESMLATDVETIGTVLSEIADAGVRIAIDDFGTGYSSLSYLQRLPFHTLKIDRSFMPRRFDGQDHAICDAVLALGEALRKSVVAEGIETAEQLLYLQSHGCQVGQGNFFGSAVAPDQFLSHYAGSTRISVDTPQPVGHELRTY